MIPAIYKNPNWLSGIFGDFFDNDGFSINKITNSRNPAINVIENDKSYRIEIAAPGMSREDFKISVINHYLDISMERKEEKKEAKKDEKCEADCQEKFLRKEFSYTRFEQRIQLPEHILENEIEAKMKHGVLRITLPKDQTKAQAATQKMIEIK